VQSGPDAPTFQQHSRVLKEVPGFSDGRAHWGYSSNSRQSAEDRKVPVGRSPRDTTRHDTTPHDRTEQNRTEQNRTEQNRTECSILLTPSSIRDLLAKNPFAGLNGSIGINRERDFFVGRDTATRVLDACPDSPWRLIFALSRYGGLRCPSEHLALTHHSQSWPGFMAKVTPEPASEASEASDGTGQRATGVRSRSVVGPFNGRGEQALLASGGRRFPQGDKGE
jgi:hypothetical protein